MTFECIVLYRLGLEVIIIINYFFRDLDRGNFESVPTHNEIPAVTQPRDENITTTLSRTPEKNESVHSKLEKPKNVKHNVRGFLISQLLASDDETNENDNSDG